MGETEIVKKIDWAKAAGYITSGVIIVTMVVLHLCGVITIKNVDSACAYTKEGVKLVSMNYLQLSKDKYTPEKADSIVKAVACAIDSTTQQLNEGKVDLSDVKNYVITEVDKEIDARSKNPELAKQLAHIAINAGFSSVETYSSGIIKDSSDYIKLLNAIKEGIEEGYKIVYPATAKTAYISCLDYYYLAA